MTHNIYQRILATIVLLLTGCANAMTTIVTKFDWGATESAPKHYPMEIIQGNFIYHGEKDSGLYIPSGGTLTKGWGKPISSHSVGEKYKPLPDRLKIFFFSYAEKQFYKGEFDLPYDEIIAMFRQSVVDNKDKPYPVFRIMVGIAPGGAVAVWVVTLDYYKEVFFGQAEKIDLDPSRAFRLPFKDEADTDKYIHDGLVEAISSEELESIKKHGIPFDLWSKYRNRYKWAPKILGGGKHLSATFINGESIRKWLNFEDINANEFMVVPRNMSFETTVNGIETIFEIYFDEKETMKAFEKLSESGEPIYMEFTPRRPRTAIGIRLYNENEFIELKKFHSTDW
jgi:hypothetical protein